ncbi:LysM peptidoglycan-binding domain-containing protein [Flavobacterium sp.]|uniref:LysM peptidoglycan-binding domain-containing protein n=1 Tax=Flavobacterium sp. TaxID=239 RepID=UPI00286E403E|nr:LysM peptidoglycan-binding domain-containing protein [Flavobacterium sp.]
MKYFITVCLATLVFSLNSFSQERNTTHKVEKGETITQIAQKYKVTPYDIYQLNPDAQSGLKPNTVLLIPQKGINSKAISKGITHKVEPKETLFGIEKKYGVSDESLKKANPELEKLGLQIGQTLFIPSSADSKIVVSTPEKVVYHEVLAKETKYSIAKQYGITIEELEKRNPEIVPNLTIGYKLIIKGNQPKTDKISVIELKKDSIKQILTKTVIPQETEIKKVYTSLSKNSDDRKKLVLLLPFNLAKIEGDTINSTATRLKKDKFLNMTLDFYSGALMAIDSAKTIGIPVDVSIFDSQETKNSSNISVIHQQNNLESADAIIGPFYQNNVEKTAALLSIANVAVISPLSKDIGNSFPNLYQTIPTADALKRAVFDYMIAKEGNIIAVVDKKKESARQFVQQNYAAVQFATLLENGSLSVANLKSLFVKDKMNYVVLASENTGMIKNTMVTMMSVMASYNVELVILELNETLDTDEISFENLTKLKLMYPSITRENNAAEAQIFKKEYRKKNKILPSTYATRGFDVTFDTMLRLSQGKSFQETADAMATQQVDNKFEYYKKPDGGYTNKGINILYYDTDLTIKEAN